MTEYNRQTEKLSWREKRRQKHVAKLAIAEANEAIARTPEGRIMNGATRAIELALKQSGGSHPINSYWVDGSDLSAVSRRSRYETRTLPIGNRVIEGIPKGTLVGLIATRQEKSIFKRYKPEFMGDPGDQLYLGVYDEVTKTCRALPLKPDTLVQMNTEQKEGLATTVAAIAVQEHSAYIEWKTPVV